MSSPKVSQFHNSITMGGSYVDIRRRGGGANKKTNQAGSKTLLIASCSAVWRTTPPTFPVTCSSLQNTAATYISYESLHSR